MESLTEWWPVLIVSFSVDSPPELIFSGDNSGEEKLVDVLKTKQQEVAITLSETFQNKNKPGDNNWLQRTAVEVVLYVWVCVFFFTYGRRFFITPPSFQCLVIEVSASEIVYSSNG